MKSKLDIFTLQQVARSINKNLRLMNAKNRREAAYNKGLDDVVQACRLTVKELRRREKRVDPNAPN